MVGGAHGNPRVSTWTQADEGRLVEVTAPFERFGGPQAVNVGRMTGGPSGWLIVGNRSSGAAVWVSPDSVNFDLVERAPELASDERGRTLAFDAVTVPDGWLVVGSVRQGGRTVPAAWMSSDGRSWRRVTVPAAGSYGQLHRVALVNAHPVAVGPRTGGFGAWRDVEAGWEVAGEFGAVQGSAPPSVRGLVVVDDRLVATISTGTAYELWLSGDEGSTWQRVVGPPVTVPVGGDTAVAATAVGRRLLVAVDGGTGAGLWLTQEPLPG
jgi:hypothetical protein